VITGDLDAELVSAARAVLPGEPLPPVAATWRPAPDGDPASFATSLPFELATHTGRPPAELAAALAAVVRPAEWIVTAAPTGAGYLTITVTGRALASVAARITAAGPACARTTELSDRATAIPPWPDLLTATTWAQAWQDQADAMTGRLAEAAGAAATKRLGRERGVSGPRPPDGARSPVAAAAAYFGADAVRYRLARTLPGRVGVLAAVDPHPEEYGAVQLAHAEAASALRWAAELGYGRPEPGVTATWLLDSAAERELLGLLSWFPLRVAGAARRGRPAEVPHYLEQVAAAWTACRLACPALPFEGSAAPGEPALARARLLLADAAATVLAAGLRLAGVEPAARIGFAACPDDGYLWESPG
jgi:arginyl-tRNA synthetase